MIYENITRANLIRRPNRFIAAEFGVALEEAKATDVVVKFLKCHVEPGKLTVVE